MVSLVRNMTVSDSQRRSKMLSESGESFNDHQLPRRDGLRDLFMLEHPGIVMGNETAFKPAASAGLMSDLGLLPTIQVTSSDKLCLATTDR